MTPSTSPKFKKPPVIETVLGVQFERIQGLSSGHLGAFWKSLGPEWKSVADAPLLEPQFERFDKVPVWGGIGLKITADAGSRLQIRSSDNDRMIQVQNGRFHYNWLGHAGGPYPEFQTVRPEFDKYLACWREFLEAQGLGSPKLNQWEVTYVNQIPKGILWNDPGDWWNVLRLVGAKKGQATRAELEGFSGDWHYELPPRQGRLHVNVRHAKKNKPEIEEILQLTLTARGPIENNSLIGLEAGLSLGHDAIVWTFKEVTTETAHNYWEFINERDN